MIPFAILLVSLLIIDYINTNYDQGSRYSNEMPFNLYRMAPNDHGSIEVKYTYGEHYLQGNLAAIKFKLDTCQEYGIQLDNYPVPQSDINSWESFNALKKYKVFEYNFKGDGKYEFWSKDKVQVEGKVAAKNLKPFYGGYKLGGILGGDTLCSKLASTVNFLLPVKPLNSLYRFQDDIELTKTLKNFDSSMYYTKIDITKVENMLRKKADIEAQKAKDLTFQERIVKKDEILRSYLEILEEEKNYFFGFLITKYKGEDHNSLIVVRDFEGNYISYIGLHDTFDIKTHFGEDLGKF